VPSVAPAIIGAASTAATAAVLAMSMGFMAATGAARGKNKKIEGDTL